MANRPGNGRALLLVLAGNTPLLGWPFLLNAVARGWTVLVKDSSDNPSSTQTLRGILSEVAPHWSERIRCLGTDRAVAQRAAEQVDALVAYGSDQAIHAWDLIANGRPFLGFGHAVSVAIWEDGDNRSLRGLIADWLTYRQQGCLSPQACLVLGDEGRARDLAKRIARAADAVADDLGVGTADDVGVAIRLREWWDTRAALGAHVMIGAGMRWSVSAEPSGTRPAWDCAWGTLPLVPVVSVADTLDICCRAPGPLSCVGFSGSSHFRDELRRALPTTTRLVRTGAMQTPGLQWRNAGVDLRQWLDRVARGITPDRVN